MGPDNVGGRTRAILIDKDNSNLIYAGGVSGGLWKSNNAGLTWNIIPGTDQLEFSGVVSTCQTSNGDIYFGTGEGATLIWVEILMVLQHLLEEVFINHPMA